MSWSSWTMRGDALDTDGRAGGPPDAGLLRQRPHQPGRPAAAGRVRGGGTLAAAAALGCPDGRAATHRRAFSGFVFKIQANTDPRHRDRIAFLRIASGRFKRGMTVVDCTHRPAHHACASPTSCSAGNG